jgi:hypothetical protein
VTPRARAFTFVTLLTLAVWLTLSVDNAPLRTPAAPAGIVSLELAGTADRVAAVLHSWGPRPREVAAFGLGLDFPFLLLYPTALSLAAGLVAERIRARSIRVSLWGKAIALSVPGAAVLDAVENAGLWRMLQLGPRGAWPMVTMACATAKFALVAIGLAFVVVAGGATLRKRA